VKRLAILASGKGSNAIKILEFFTEHKSIEVSAVLSNNIFCGAYEGFLKAGKKAFHFQTNDELINHLKNEEITHVILAGYLKLIPKELTELYSQKIINIHPALLPKYGGKGMYGMHVHKAVKENAEEETGISIHLVNEEYDKGEILFQAKTKLEPTDSAEDIALKVSTLEHEHFPQIIEKYITDGNI